MFSTYRRLLAEPGLRSLMVIGLLAKMPGLGISTVLILHIVGHLHRGFAAGSLVAACWTAGAGLGAPLQGRGLDRYGLRRVFGLLVTAQAVFWSLAHFLPYPVLLGAAFLGGLTTLPAFTVIRLALAGLVTDENRHTAYAVDAMTTDIAYMAGPTIGILLASTASPTVAFLVMGGLQLLVGVAYLVLDPPLQQARPTGGPTPGLRSWLTARMVCALGVTVATSIAVVGFEVAAVGTLQRHGQLAWSWLLLVLAGVASVAGGFLYGAMKRPPSVFVLTAVLGLLCMPIGLATQWYWLCLLAVPANLFVAPALSASAGAVSGIAPEGTKGVAMGTYASAILVGNVIGSPLAGAGLDHGGPKAAFAVFGATAAAVAALAHVCDARLRSRQKNTEHTERTAQADQDLEKAGVTQ
ncbi:MULTISPECIES: MFS transporter [unclassified Streptomyces]|uniref:MFS transporter n=1 Tax=unclassified Streptomyces TaxID=2593676 RepID=UPI0011A7262B|nr:MFS transporter [Streptomyces sp. BK340]TVZ94122.1 putative MFS family arabinose efflux permease [Streptomyces sp. BK340]